MQQEEMYGKISLSHHLPERKGNVSPHIEIFCFDPDGASFEEGKWMAISGTKHRPNDRRIEKVLFAHSLLTCSSYKQIREVEDDLGPACDETNEPGNNHH